MAKPITSYAVAKTVSLILFLVGLVIATYYGTWWPGIMLVIGLPLALRQYLLGKHFDMIVSLFVFIGVFLTVEFKIAWQVLLPVLFCIGGIYIFFREFLEKPKD